MNLKNLILGVGIVVVFGLLLWQGVETFNPSPEYEDFCNLGKFNIPSRVDYGANCSFSAELREQESQCSIDGGQPVYNYDDKGCAVSVKECDFCNKEYEEELKSHSQVVFIISLIAGLIVLLIGYFILSVEPVGSALIGSGIWALFWGSAVNWRNFANWIRFVLLLIAFVFIVWLTLRLNRERKGSFGK